jgi:hypothetical protein
MDSNLAIGIRSFSSTYFFRYRNRKCQCGMSNMANITVDVDVHLCQFNLSSLPVVVGVKI